MKKQIIFLSSVLVLVIFSLLLGACAEDSDSSDSESQSTSTDTPQQGMQGKEDISGEGKLCGDGTCDATEEETGFCKADCE